MRDKLFVIVVSLFLLGGAVVFCTFPRSTWSDLERRELLAFPDFSFGKLLTGKFTADVSTWFSDSEPYRDKFMNLSMWLKDKMSISLGKEDDQILVHSSQSSSTKNDQIDNSTWESQSRYIVVGSAPYARALASFDGTIEESESYISVINKYQETLGHKVTLYSMVVPTSIEFYCPEAARELTHPQRPVIDYIYSKLDENVITIDVYSVLASHLDEQIYFRTDHHWTPLSGYYAAREFARIAGVKVPNIEDFQQHVRHDFLGSLNGKVQSMALKESPEDFVYYTPQHEYTAHYCIFKINDDYELASDEETRIDGPFFVEQFLSRRGSAYNVFMGGNNNIARVECKNSSRRRLLIMKDSYGNSVPGYLFGSFGEVHIVDYRFFPHSIVDYVQDNEITDLLFINNAGLACYTVPSAYLKMLERR